jgi:DnaJ-class molecular chaperone
MFFYVLFYPPPSAFYIGITIFSCYHLERNARRKRVESRMHYLPDDYYVGNDADPDAEGPFHIDCAFCNGTGVHPATMKMLEHRPCPACLGSGWLHFSSSRKDFSTCPRCEGTGRDTGTAAINPCNQCGGRGIV